jgi:hypothetical protein
VRLIAAKQAKSGLPRALPDRAPETWPGKCHAHDHEKYVAAFFRRVWAKYIPLGLTLSYLKNRDLRLYNAINNYHVTYGRPWPNDLKMQTPRTRLATLLDRLETKGSQALTPQELLCAARKLVREKSSSSSATTRRRR